MINTSIIRNSSILIAYMGTLGWGSAYFYGWGVSFYYGFPWWVVSAGLDEVARSLFYAFTVMTVFLIGWGFGIMFFFSVKRNSNMKDLSFVRLFMAMLLMFAPLVIEVSIVKNSFSAVFLIVSVIIAFMISGIIRLFSGSFKFKRTNKEVFIKKHYLELLMIGFILYFWVFSFVAGWYKPQVKKQYEMIQYDNQWYYVIARYDSCLILSKSFVADTKRFIVFRSYKAENYEINIIQSRL